MEWTAPDPNLRIPEMCRLVKAGWGAPVFTGGHDKAVAAYSPPSLKR